MAALLPRAVAEPSVVLPLLKLAMPLKVLRPCVAVLDELARNYRSSVVLCTATQPALKAPNVAAGLEGFEGGLENVRELAPEPARLFERLKRVTVKQVGTLDDAALHRTSSGTLQPRRPLGC